MHCYHSIDFREQIKLQKSLVILLKRSKIEYISFKISADKSKGAQPANLVGISHKIKAC